ncbi:unnamed protein product [Mytilus coruscus]|uniref:Tyr recombinase domain-containing protein n=1 Tax=Mytilus coruscus TaxID=42192 RepID=A0A6J8CVV2_MYTCO|nr:unnamed protein product [Mytilus coruscus]
MGIDAFTINWQGANGWFVPPVCLVSKVISYMRQCFAHGTLVLPLWKSASFWPMLCPTGEGFIKEVKGCIDLPTNKKFYTSGKGNKSAFQSDLLELPDTLIEKIHLLPDLLTESKSNNTVQNYYYGFLRWKKWALSNGISSEFILPAKPIHVAIYLACLVQQNRTPSPINQAFYSIRWAHKIISVISPTDSDLVKNILEGAKRRLSVPIKKKEPITPDMLSQMFDRLYCENNLYNQRTISACLLSYSGFLRVSELLNLKTCDIQFFLSHMSVFIQKSKTDIYRDGDRIIIARTGNKLCPVKNLESFLEWSNNPLDTDVFRMISSYLFSNQCQQTIITSRAEFLKGKNKEEYM